MDLWNLVHIFKMLYLHEFLELVGRSKHVALRNTYSLSIYVLKTTILHNLRGYFRAFVGHPIVSVLKHFINILKILVYDLEIHEKNRKYSLQSRDGIKTC